MLNVRKLGIQLFEVLFSQSNNMLYSSDLQERRRKNIERQVCSTRELTTSPSKQKHRLSSARKINPQQTRLQAQQ